MFYNFEEYLLEALRVIPRQDGISHYDKRIDLRISNLTVDKLIKTGKTSMKVNVEIDTLKIIEDFFKKALYFVSNSKNSKIFNDIDVSYDKFAIIRLCKTKIILSDGTEVEPIFKITTSKGKTGVGRYFWIFTDKDIVTTIKLYDVEGKSPKEKDYLINKGLQHAKVYRAQSLKQKLNYYKPGTDPKETFSVIINPINKPELVLDLQSSAKPIEEQLKDIEESVTSEVKDPENIRIFHTPTTDELMEIENVPKQMTLIPGKVWYLEFNDKFQKWGAAPIEDAIISKDISSGNSIDLKLGPKHVHWIENENPLFAPPKNIIINKGDKVVLAKRLGDGNWARFIGDVTEISTDIRHTKYPFIKTNGWENIVMIDKEDSDKLFLTKTNESLLNFNSWLYISIINC